MVLHGMISTTTDNDTQSCLYENHDISIKISQSRIIQSYYKYLMFGIYSIDYESTCGRPLYRFSYDIDIYISLRYVMMHLNC